MLDIDDLMRKLARDRPLFHSEADFQHALAWRIHKEMPDCGVRLEYKPFSEQRKYLDLWLNQLSVAIELKYRTRELELELDGEPFKLRNQSANDISRYDFLNDIHRLETLSEFPRAKAGFAIFLTNDHLYWNEPTRSTIDKNFRLHENRVLRGKMTWKNKASPGTKKNREDPIELIGSYEAHWQEYGDSAGPKYRRFRYLAISMTY